MELTLNFNAQEVKPQEANFEPVPNAWYQMVIEKAELKPTKSPGGSYISLMCNIQGPTHANRKVFGNLNVTNQSAQAQEIGQAQLSALCHAIGVMQLNNVQQLVGIPLEIRTKIAAAVHTIKGDTSSPILYEARNELAGFRAVGAGAVGAGVSGGVSGGAPAKPAAPAAPARPSAPAASVAAQTAPAQVNVQAEASASQAAPQETVGTAANPPQPW